MANKGQAPMQFKMKFKAWLPAVLLGLLSLDAQAQAGSRISQVLVYPGGATVDRVAKVAKGSTQLALPCLPASFDVASLQMSASPGIQLGEVTVQTLDRNRLPECRRGPLDARIRELEDQAAAVQAEITAQELALGYLKGLGGDRAAVAATISANAEAVRRQSQDLLQRQHTLERRKQDIDQQLAPLQAERDQALAQNPKLRRVLVQLVASAEGELQLSYRVPQAGWTPQYQAWLDTATGQLDLKRQAQVAQTSGEDWAGVRLRLSTVQPRQAAALPPVWPWQPNILPPEAMVAKSAAAYAMAAPAPATVAMGGMARDRAEPSPFDVSLFQGEFEAQFEVPGLVDVASNGQQVALRLGQQGLPAQVFARVQPRQQAKAYLVAEVARPAGSWPRGALQLFRDGSFVGQSQLDLGTEPRLEVFFGVDDLMRVAVAPEQRLTANAGLMGGRLEQRYVRSYEVENRHQRAFTVQLVEASPAPVHEDIKLQAQWQPQPSIASWKKQPGVVAWQLEVKPGQTLQFNADYLLSYPKDARVVGLQN
jgi:uncharacterized protein (TIGR02231 family)